jgi:GDP-L-fucose synthase
MNKDAKIFVAGARGMVGSSIVRALESAGYSNLLTPMSRDLDLRDQKAVKDYFETEKPEYVFLAAAKVGGILANKMANADFFYDNMAIELNVIHEASLNGVKKLCFLGSSCIYPKLAEQPVKEEALMTGRLESSNFGYATAKIAGVKMCEAYHEQYGLKYVALMPCNLFGPGDNFDPEKSHVLPALLKKVIDAEEVGASSIEIWGSGEPYREFLFVDDIADACLFLMESDVDHGLFNVGMGEDVTINELIKIIFEVVGYNGEVTHDRSKPDGTPRKLLNVSRLQNLGWKYKVSLREGIEMLKDWYLENR